MNSFTILFLVALAANVGVHLWLGVRHLRHVRAHRDAVPEAFAAQIPLVAHRKAADYTAARTRFGQVELVWNALLVLAWTLGGGLAALDRMWLRADFGPLAHGVAVLLSALVLMSLLELPGTLYRTFVIEQRFGFNRMTPRLFAIDLLKEALLLFLLGIPMATLVLWLMHRAGSMWWLYVWAAWMAFSLLMLWAYPRFIAPLFNTFKPLDDASLRERIESLLARNGFASNGIFVMDGSTRSAHGNAYFTGFGANKRIVFFDTLIDELDPPEIEAVLAHELGHFKLRHVFKNIVLMALLTLAGLALLGWLIDQPWFYEGLGVDRPSVHTALVLFMLTVPVFSFLLQPLTARLSRRFEFEADAYAARNADARSLIRALVKLYKENANTLTPDPLWSGFHDSHPPAPVRIARLEALAR